MKMVKYISISLVAIFFTMSCKKVIELKLNDSTPQIVITGEINNEVGPYYVNITKSVNFQDENIFPAVTGAMVVINGNGISDTLTESSPGKYQTSQIIGASGSRYSLKVVAEGNVYEASSTMPQYVALDSIDFMESTRNSIFPVAYFQDPKGTDNYYQFIESIDGNRLLNGKGIFVFDDRLSDGRYINRVMYNDSSDIKRGTLVTVEMRCIDKPVYNYWVELLQISGGGGGFSSPTPANPGSNISGGAFGYFSAQTISRKSARIP